MTQLTLPSAAFKEAQAKGIKPDELYALELLELTGLATTPGSAFSLPDDQPYIRLRDLGLYTWKEISTKCVYAF